ncbi:MAG: hypothetical protein M1830_002096, partial [Pleopsidium flavum]
SLEVPSKAPAGLSSPAAASTCQSSRGSLSLGTTTDVHLSVSTDRIFSDATTVATLLADYFTYTLPYIPPTGTTEVITESNGTGYNIATLTAPTTLVVSALRDYNQPETTLKGIDLAEQSEASAR